MAGLKVEWKDPRGVTWNLTDGTQGVILARGQSGLGLPKVTHQYDDAGRWASTQLGRAEPDLKVHVGLGLNGDDWFRLADEWWSKANSAFQTGELVVTRPDGTVRRLRARLRETPGITYDYDPGLPDAVQGENPDAWMLTADGSYWEGAEQSVIINSTALGALFYGSSGHGWPLYIASEYATNEKTLTNSGDAEMWIRWELVGPVSNPRVGTEQGELRFIGDVPPGDVVVIETQPGYRSVRNSLGENLLGKVWGTWAPMAKGGRRPIVAYADSIGAGGAIRALARERFVRAF